MKRLIILLAILALPLSLNADMNTYVIGCTAAGGSDWTPASFRFFEGSDDVAAGNYKVLLYDSSGNLAAISEARTYAQGDSIITIAVDGTPDDISASSTYYIGLVVESNYMRYDYVSGSATWDVSDEGGSYALPTDPADGTYGGEFNGSVPCVWVANAAGQRLVGWGTTSGGEAAQVAADTTLIYGTSATSESSPVTP